MRDLTLVPRISVKNIPERQREYAHYMNFRERIKKIELSDVAFLIVILAAAIYYAVFIYKSSFVINGERYFVLFDDAMISMNYARNLAQGEGLVWSPGERVEGYSNLLWVIIMAFFHLLPIASAKISLTIQVLGAIFALATLIFVKLTADELVKGNAWVGVIAAFITAFYYPLLNWNLLGNEVSLLAMLITAAVWLALRSLRQGRFSVWLYMIIALGSFVRIDAILPFAVIILYLIIVDGEHRRKHIAYGIGVVVASLILQTIFRGVYFGDWLPNTYYLKMTGAPLFQRVFRGLFVFVKFIWNLNWLLFLLPFIVFIIHRDKGTTLVMLVILVQLAYSVYVGGDAWEHRGGSNRFISGVMPLYFTLFTLALDQVRVALLNRAKIDQNKFIEVITMLGVFVIAGISLLNFNAVLDTASLRYMLLRDQPLYVRGNERNTTIGLFTEEITTEDASVAVIAAGAEPYFSERYSIDMFGKSDPKIAKGEMHIPEDLALIDFRPGHMKWDYAWSIGFLEPDVVVEIWRGTSQEAAPYLEDYIIINVDGLTEFLPDGRMFLRRGSPNIYWDKVSGYIQGS